MCKSQRFFLKIVLILMFLAPLLRSKEWPWISQLLLPFTHKYYMINLFTISSELSKKKLKMFKSLRTYKRTTHDGQIRSSEWLKLCSYIKCYDETSILLVNDKFTNFVDLFINHWLVQSTWISCWRVFESDMRFLKLEEKVHTYGKLLSNCLIRM